MLKIEYKLYPVKSAFDKAVTPLTCNFATGKVVPTPTSPVKLVTVDDTCIGKSLPAPSDKVFSVPSIDVLFPTFIRAGYVADGVVLNKEVPILIPSLSYVLPQFSDILPVRLRKWRRCKTTTTNSHSNFYYGRHIRKLLKY
jgi:hypothetical protein